jgi:hypothetical protein
MDAYGCSVLVSLLGAGHAEKIEETHNPEEISVSLFNLLVQKNRDK